MKLSGSRKKVFEGVGNVHNCTCHDYNHQDNQYHTLDCESFTNMTIYHHLSPTQRFKAHFMPTNRDLTKQEIKKLGLSPYNLAPQKGGSK